MKDAWELFIIIKCSFNELFEKARSVLIHIKKIPTLTNSKLSPPVINSIFKPNSDSRCSLRQISPFFISFVRSVYHGAESIPYLGLKICDILPDDNKTKKNWDTFKIKNKNGNQKTARLSYVKFILIDQVFL